MASVISDQPRASSIGIKPHYLVVMGVSGTGKTTIAARIADKLSWNFQEGDLLHPLQNVEKMRSGQPLTDEDRAPWLALCRDWLKKQVEMQHGAVLTCSALKRRYREQLSKDLPVQFIYLHTSFDVLNERLHRRTGHFMPPSLLSSQLATLEEPDTDEPVIRVSGEAHPSLVLRQVVEKLQHV